MSRFSELDLGLVVRGHGRHYIVEDSDGQRRVCHPRGKKSDCVVGDEVRWAPSGSDEGVIEAVEPRRNLLFRQDEWKTKSFAANVDQLLILVAVEPVFSESQLCRALIAAEAAGIHTTICPEQDRFTWHRLGPRAPQALPGHGPEHDGDCAQGPARGIDCQANALVDRQAQLCDGPQRHRQKHPDQSLDPRRQGPGGRYLGGLETPAATPPPPRSGTGWTQNASRP